MVNKPKKLRALVDEEWREVPGSEGRYLVSSYGRVKSFAIDKEKGQMLKFTILKRYKYLNLRYGKRTHLFFIHKLVAQVWLPRPSKQHTIVTHIDRNLSNNHYSNLEWVTIEESRKRNGEYYSKAYSGIGKRNNAKLSESDIIQLKKMLALGVPQNKIAKMFCLSEMQITRIKRGENWGSVKLPESTSK